MMKKHPNCLARKLLSFTHVIIRSERRMWPVSVNQINSTFENERIRFKFVKSKEKKKTGSIGVYMEMDLKIHAAAATHSQ